MVFVFVLWNGVLVESQKVSGNTEVCTLTRLSHMTEHEQKIQSIDLSDPPPHLHGIWKEGPIDTHYCTLRCVGQIG